MNQNFVRNEVIFQKIEGQDINQSIKKLSSNLHKCALLWSNKCAHCDTGFDALKLKLSSSNVSEDDFLKELATKIEKIEAELQGYLKLFKF